MAYIGAEPDGQGKAQRFTFTASGGETVVSVDNDGIPIGYTSGQVSVFLNGVKLVVGTDCIATNGSTITGLAALAASDVVEVVALSIFSATTVEGTALISTGETGGSKFLREDGDGTSSWQTVTEYNDDVIQTNIALLAFKTAVNGSLAKYNLQDQVIDEYTDATGVDGTPSTNHVLTAGVYSSSVAASNPTGGSGGSAGAGETYTDGGVTYRVHTFTANADLVVPSGASGTIKAIMMVGGGGSGAGRHSGGGGGGELLYGTTDWTLSAGTHAIVIGAGGSASTGVDAGTGASEGAARNGGNTTFNGVTANGGGGGGNYGHASGGSAHRGAGVAGGSGGGAGGAANDQDPAVTNALSTKSNETSPFVATAYGNNGGMWGGSDSHDGGGGGGAGAVGGDAATALSGVGGAGYQINDFNQTHHWAGGGGGHGWQSAAAAGGTGGGGGGSSSNSTVGAGGTSALTAGGAGVQGGTGGAGGANTGSGGGGGSSSGGAHDEHGGAGGSGIVKIKYVDNSFGAISDLTLQSTDTTAEAVPTKADMVMLMEDSAGTATINTDIKGFVSRDSGSTFIEGVLVDEGDWGTNKRILAFHDLSFTGASGTAMCYKITTHNQASAKQTKIHATSIGWR